MKVKTDRVLLDVEAGASDELLPLVKQSFRDGRYSLGWESKRANGK
jgi:hypothetical protein